VSTIEPVGVRVRVRVRSGLGLGLGLVSLSLSLSLACGGDGLKDGVGVLDRERDEHAAQRTDGRAQHLVRARARARARARVRVSA